MLLLLFYFFSLSLVLRRPVVLGSPCSLEVHSTERTAAPCPLCNLARDKWENNVAWKQPHRYVNLKTGFSPGNAPNRRRSWTAQMFLSCFFLFLFLSHAEGGATGRWLPTANIIFNRRMKCIFFLLIFFIYSLLKKWSPEVLPGFRWCLGWASGRKAAALSSGISLASTPNRDRSLQLPR